MGVLKKLLFLIVFFAIILSLNVFGASLDLFPQSAGSDGKSDGTSDTTDGGNLWVDLAPDFSTIWRSFIEYDLSSISGSTVTGVTLDLTSPTGAGGNKLEIVYLPNGISSYTDGNLYSGILSSTDKVSNLNYPGSSDSPSNYDLSSIVSVINTDVLSGDGIFILGLKDSTESSGSDVYFYDRAVATDNYKPELHITYTPASGSSDNPPTVVLKTPGDGSTQTIEIINFTANVTDDYNVTTCSLYTNFTGSWTINSTQTVNTNESLINFTLNVSDLNNGNYKWNINCSDNATNWNSSTSNFTFTLNIDEPPTVNATAPVNGTLYNGFQASINFVADISADVDYCEFELYKGVSPESSQTDSFVSYPQTFTVNNLAEGRYSWYMRCNDTSDQQANTSWQYFDIGTLGITNVNSPTNVNNTDTFQYEVQVQCTGYCGDVNVTLDPYPSKTSSFWQKILNFFRTITGMAASGDIPSNSGDPFYTTNTTSQMCLNMQDETCNVKWDVVANGSANNYNFFAYANDTTHTLNAQTATIQIAINDNPPTIILTGPANDTKKNKGSTISFTANVQDDYNISNCSLWNDFDGIFKEDTLNIDEVNDSSDSLTFTRTLSNLGNYNWSIKCTDNNSQTTSSETRLLTIKKANTGGGTGGGGGGGDDDDEEDNPCDGVDCDDGDECTRDSCSEGTCSNTPIPNCPDLCAGINCNDDDPCTTDSCSEGSCSNTPIPNCLDLCANKDCDDNDPCTIDSCSEGSCQHENKPNCGDECVGPDCDEDECVGPNCESTCEDCSNNLNFFCNESEELCDDFIDELMQQTSSKINLTKNVTYNNLTNQTEVKLQLTAEEDLENLEFYQSIPKCMAYYVHLVKFKNTDFEIIKDDPLIVWHFDSVAQGEVIDLSFEVLGKIPPECHELLKELFYEEQERFSPSYKLAATLSAILISVSLLLIGISKVDPKAIFNKHKYNQKNIKSIDQKVDKLLKEVE